jgi:hypothetical protein
MTDAPSRKLLKRKLKRREPQPADVAYPELEALIERAELVHKQAAALVQEYKIRQNQILTFMKSRGLDKYDRGKFGVTPVYPEGEEVDWDGIQKVLTEKGLWDQILGEPLPVKSKLEALIELGIVKKHEIQDFVAVKPIAPSIRIRGLTK